MHLTSRCYKDLDSASLRRYFKVFGLNDNFDKHHMCNSIKQGELVAAISKRCIRSVHEEQY